METKNKNYNCIVLILIFLIKNCLCSNPTLYEIKNNQLVSKEGNVVALTIQKIDPLFHTTKKIGNVTDSIQYLVPKEKVPLTNDSHLIAVDNNNKNVTIIGKKDETSESLALKFKMALQAHVNLFFQNKTQVISINTGSFYIQKDMFIQATKALLHDSSLFSQPSTTHQPMQEITQAAQIHFLIDSNNPIISLGDLIMIVQIFAEKITSKSPVKFKTFLTKIEEYKANQNINTQTIDALIAEFNELLLAQPEIAQKRTPQKPPRWFGVINTLFAASPYLIEGYYAYKGYQHVGSLKGYLTKGMFFDLPQNKAGYYIRFLTKSKIAHDVFNILKSTYYWIKNRIPKGKQ